MTAIKPPQKYVHHYLC